MKNRCVRNQRTKKTAQKQRQQQTAKMHTSRCSWFLPYVQIARTRSRNPEDYRRLGGGLPFMYIV